MLFCSHQLYLQSDTKLGSIADGLGIIRMIGFNKPSIAFKLSVGQKTTSLSKLAFYLCRVQGKEHLL